MIIRGRLRTPSSGHTNANTLSTLHIQTIDQTYPVHEPHSGICYFSHDSVIAFLDNIDIDSSDTVSFAETQVFFNWFLRECHEGVGGIEADSVGVVGV